MTRVERTLDIENLVDYFLIRFEDMDAPHTVRCYEMVPGTQLDRQAIVDLLAQTTMLTFNGINYDLPILMLALTGADNKALKDAGDLIIQEGCKWWNFFDMHGLEVPDWIDHIDLMEVAPGVRVGLKMYMGRMHCPKMQDLPLDHAAPVAPEMRQIINDYCGNDHQGTREMRLQLQERLDLRIALSQQYGVDLRSKSDAQIAEGVIKARLGFTPHKRFIAHGYTFRYNPPEDIAFATPAMRALLDAIRVADFVVSDKEQVEMMGMDGEGIRTGVLIPEFLKGHDIRMGETVYRMGIGGLHSQESRKVHYTIPGVQTISDHDVASYYPSMILKMRMFPQQLGQDFLTIYEDVYHTRLAAKAAGRKTEDGGLKIVLNGTFGKLFSKYSILYAPEFGIRTTISGQLYLLMLIEMLELSGISVVSANTDGIVLRVPAGREAIRDQVIAWWEKRTGLTMEANVYRAIFSRDVNNYIAITSNGKIKRKGVYATPGLLQNKHPDQAICAEAVVQFVAHGRPIEATIRECQDIRQFLVVRQVQGGAVYVPAGVVFDENCEYLGKAVRWYYGGKNGHLAYKGSGNLVARSTGATPIMELPSSLPSDIHYQHYIDVAEEMLCDIGLGIPF